MVYSYLDYSDDYELSYAPTDGGHTPGKKLLSFPEINHVQGTIRLKGNTRLPQGDEVITVQASLSENLNHPIRYKGTVQDKGQGIIEGKKSRPLLSSPNLFIGTTSKFVTESIEIKGRKDYIELINKIQDVLELEEESYDDYDWGDKVEEAKYQGRTVKLNKPFRTSGGPKKFAVYVMNNQGNVVIVRFGDPNMDIKRDDPERRKSFRARHNCSQKKDRTTPGYWSCKFWSSKRVGDLA